MKRFLSHFEEVRVENLADATVARRVAGETAQAMGLSPQRAAEAVLVASELAHNHVMHHTNSGRIRISGFHVGEHPCLVLASLDRGPGLDRSFAQILHACPRGEGLGAGLKTVVRLSDRVDSFSRKESGVPSAYETVIIALLGPEELPRGAMCRAGGRFGVMSRAKIGAHLYGDGVKIQEEGMLIRITMVDSPGLGDAAAQTTRSVFTALDGYPLGWPPAQVLEELEFALAKRGGAAVACLLLNSVTGRLQSASVGNLGALLYVDGNEVDAGRESGLVGLSPWRRIKGREYAAGKAITLCLYSDGQTPLMSLPSLDLPPQILAQLLFAPHESMRDDATLLVMQWPEKAMNHCIS